MLVAHANTTIEDFIAQLRTYVIAMGLSQQVVDCVDELETPDEAYADGAKDMKEDILETLETWCNEQFKFPEQLKISLAKAIKETEARE